jgi:hypothetical protein
MPNRPVIGQTAWGGTLNDHLGTSINIDGTLKDTAISAGATTINAALNAKYDGTVVDGLVNAEAASRISGITNRGIDVTLGPFYINDIPANASTAASFGYFDTATTMSQNNTGIKIKRGGRLIGIMIIADTDITAGTATARIRISGTTWSNLTSALDTFANPRSNSVFDSVAGSTFLFGQFIGANIVTSADFAPTTMNAQVSLILRLDDF